MQKIDLKQLKLLVYKYKSTNKSKYIDKIFNTQYSTILKVSKSIDDRFKGSLEVEDLVSAGKIGLLKAIKHYDSKKHHNLQNYMTESIKNEILLYALKESKLIRIPNNIQASFYKAKKYNEDDPCNIMSKLNYNIKKAIYINDNIVYFSNINNLSDLNVIPIYETCFIGENLEEIIIRKLNKRYLIDLLNNLTSQEKNILVKRYGIFENPMTLEEIGHEYELTKQRIKQIQDTALKKLIRKKATLKLDYDNITPI